MVVVVVALILRRSSGSSSCCSLAILLVLLLLVSLLFLFLLYGGVIESLDAHVGAYLEGFAPPRDRPAEQHGPRPHGEGEEFPAEPGGEPLVKRPSGRRRRRGRGGKAPRKGGRVLVALDGAAPVQPPEDGAVARHPDGHAHEPQEGHGRARGGDAERGPEEGQGGRGRGVGEGEVAQEGLDARLDERGEQDGELAGAQPADAARAVRGHGHARHGLHGEVAPDEAVVPEPREVGAPEEVADQVVLADVAREEVDAAAAALVGVGGAAEVGVVRRVGVLVEVALAEHVALADDAGGDADGVDGAVELGVAGRHEHLVEAAAARGQDAGEERAGLWGGSSGGDVDLEGHLVDEAVGHGVLAVGQVAHQLVDHAPGDALGDPDIAVDDPDDVALGLAVGAADVADLGVRPQLVARLALEAGDQGVVLLHEQAHVELGRVLGDDLLEHGVGGVVLGGDAQPDGQPGPGVGLAEGRDEARVQFGLEALDGADDGDVGDLVLGEGRRDGLARRVGVVPEAVGRDERRTCVVRACWREGQTMRRVLFSTVVDVHFVDAYALHQVDNRTPDQSRYGGVDRRVVDGGGHDIGMLTRTRFRERKKKKRKGEDVSRQEQNHRGMDPPSGRASKCFHVSS